MKCNINLEFRNFNRVFHCVSICRGNRLYQLSKAKRLTFPMDHVIPQLVQLLNFSQRHTDRRFQTNVQWHNEMVMKVVANFKI
jgi:hypothetical protein